MVCPCNSVDVPGALDILLALGFVKDGEILILPLSTPIQDVQPCVALLEKLKSSQRNRYLKREQTLAKKQREAINKESLLARVDNAENKIIRDSVSTNGIFEIHNQLIQLSSVLWNARLGLNLQPVKTWEFKPKAGEVNDSGAAWCEITAMKSIW